MWFAIFVVFIFAYIYLKKFYSFFEEIGFPYVPGKFPFGSITGVGYKEHTSNFFKREYDRFKHQAPAFGMFFINRKTFVATEPELVKEVLVKSFDNFHDHGFPVNEKADPLSNNIFFTKGQQWKELRAKLSPTFTSGRMKMMFPIVESKADRMMEFLNSKINSGDSYELKELFASYTTESISSVAFGIEANCHGNAENKFRKIGKMVFEPPAWENIKNFLGFASERLTKILNLSFNPQEVTDFFLGAVKETLEYREQNKIERNDFFQLGMNIMKSDPDFKFTEMAANCFIFFLAGFETSSSASTFMSYELAQNEAIQNRLRDEINEVLERHNGEVTYDAIMEMKYLDMIFNETLRKWPIVDSQFRKCEKDFPIPNSKLTIPAETFVIIPTIGLHLDERFWEEPEKFDPERFNDENKKKIVPFSYVPFSEGPRICIGLRFGTMQTKIAMVKLLKSFKLLTCSKTNIPMKLVPTAAMQCPQNGMWLKLEKID